ncbi:MAG: protein kinase, partial [Phycisphaerae bacterium]
MSTRLFERTESADPCVIRTVLFSDLVGSTSLVVSLGDQCSSRLWAQHDRIARDLLPLFAGKEIDKSDGFFMLFDRPIDAVGYALAYHDRFAELSKEFGVAVGARVGIHMGEVLLRVNEDIDIARGAKCLEVTGLAVPTAARVMSLAGKGQTLLTGATFDLARRAAVGDQSIPSEVCWMNHGPYEFKGLDGAVPVCEVGRTGVAPLAPPLDSAKARRCFDPTAVQTGTWRPAPRQVVPGSGGWRLQRRLGQGGFGEVWLARHSKQRAARAFKFWFAGDWRRAPKQEMALCQHLVQRLGVRNDIVRVYGHRIDNPPYFLEMEYVREGNLAEWAARQGGIAKVPLDIRLELVAQIAVALAAAHSVGIIHKDIKPTNVLIRHADDEAPTACLTDFGIGQLVVIQTLQANRDTTPGGAAVDLASLATTTTGTNAGTRLYMSPEYMVKGAAIGHQSDIYALGVLLFQMIVGDLSRPLVHGWQKSIDDELLRAAIEDCIAEAPAERLEHADTLAERLRSIGARRQALEAVRRRTRGWKRVGFSMRVLLLTSVLVAHVALGVLLGSRRVQDARAQALGILARFGSDPNVALEATKSASEMVRQYYGEAIAHQLFSSAAVERVTAARAALWADESVEAAFWASSNGGPVWEHGDWMQVCKAHFLNPTPLIPKLAARAEKGTDHEKYIAFCLLGDLAEPDDALAEMCARAAATETHPGVSAAAYWAAGRLWQSLPVRKHGDRSPIEPDGMV